MCGGYVGELVDFKEPLYKVIDVLPITAHPMTQFATGVMALQVVAGAHQFNYLKYFHSNCNDECRYAFDQPLEGEGEENLLPMLASVMPQAVTVTPEEREAIERTGNSPTGFTPACNKDEGLAANYLLDHMDELENEEDETS
ncbi:hypothetical protein Ancab_034733 [Ancistrocladus abbreviatus]